MSAATIAGTAARPLPACGKRHHSHRSDPRPAVPTRGRHLHERDMARRTWPLHRCTWPTGRVITEEIARLTGVRRG